MPFLFLIGFDRSNKVRSVAFNPILPTPVDPGLEKLSRSFLADLMANHYDQAARFFDATVRQQLTPANLAGLRENILKLYGPLQSVSGVRERIQPPYRIIDVIATCERMPLALRIAFDTNDRMVSIHISPNIEPAP